MDGIGLSQPAMTSGMTVLEKKMNSTDIYIELRKHLPEGRLWMSHNKDIHAWEFLWRKDDVEITRHISERYIHGASDLPGWLKCEANIMRRQAEEAHDNLKRLATES